MINHAARLGKLSGDRKYFDQADQFYQFLLKSGLITSSFEVIDGIGKEDNVCKISLSQFSYESGMASGALAYLYYSTKNDAYLDTAHKIFQTGMKTFTQRSIVYDASSICRAPNDTSFVRQQ
jgi:predicted alpha-1,6-mannanase (GH76 family)